ncbi:hypothetical protein H4219_000598 [Mycoemilia scoparia]|uniref:Inositol-pentakisphosphate 2-kinase n=1 Tax=Mycoemilia scoparia TaxID=417184 RepID=A0A9W8DWU0_9FUNG|nr:hypothetical protein H4219_000598 [Mycoemilia scoparia]
MAQATTIDEQGVLDATQWKYKGEGNANILISYHGPNSHFIGSLIRLSKVDKHSSQKWHERQVLDNIAFAQDVIQPLLSTDVRIIPQMIPLNVDRQFLTEVSELIEPFRPEKRKNRMIDISQEIAILTSDMTAAPNEGQSIISVEIKPKWGFIPNSTYISENTEVKTKICRFCLHKWMKSKSHVDDISLYCPMDLYSGETSRIARAIDALIVTPQNNFRVFIDGSSVDVNDVAPEIFETIKDILPKILSKSGVLKRLAQLQASLDSHDIEGVLPLYNSFLDNCKTIEEPELSEWRLVAKAFLENEKERRGLAPNDHKSVILRYLLSMTLKDVSLFVSIIKGDLSPRFDSEINFSEYSSLSGNKVKAQVAIIDTDRKSIFNIPSNYKKDQDIVENYLNVDKSLRDIHQCTAYPNGS